ncbi:MAG: hypothetical protein HOH33_07510 [Verrucomicrobia bacterium]|jgi:beta-lactamase regulating signal transducer with metallopeptidase domain|nr:hypothetical protein [Verrucomicrobiota bacterium]
MNINLENAWVEILKLFTIHSTWIVGLGFLAAKTINNTYLRRTIWRSVMVCLTLLVLFAFSGLYQWNVSGLLTASRTEKGSNFNQLQGSSEWEMMQVAESSESLLIKSQVLYESAFQETDTALANRQANMQYLAWTYVSGTVIVGLLMSLNALWWCRRILFNAEAVSQPVLQLFKTTADALEFHQSPALVEIKQLKTPLVMGFIRPVMAFPKHFSSQFSAEEQSLIMANEIAHLRENDGQWQCLANLICALMWWHPLSWTARRSLRQCAEETADAISAVESTDRNRLAECLVRIGREMTVFRWTGSLSIFGPGFRSQLGKRVNHLLNGQPEWNRKPGRLNSRLLKYAIPAISITLFVTLTSWFGLNKNESASTSLRQSISGMVLVAQGNGNDLENEIETIDPASKSNNIITNKISTPLKEAKPMLTQDALTDLTLTRLKSTILPEFKILKDDVWNNLCRLREEILRTDPDWTTLIFSLSGPVTQNNETTTQTQESSAGVISVNAISYVNMSFNQPVMNPSTLNQLPLDETNSFSVSNASVHMVLSKILESTEGPSKFTVDGNTVSIHLPAIVSKRINNPFESKTEIPLNSHDEFTPLEDPENKLLTRTYKTNPKTFIPRLRAIVGTLATSSLSPQGNAINVNEIVVRFVRNLGINISEPSEESTRRGIYYNDQRGALLARLPLEEMNLLETAISALQDRSERTTQIALDMKVVELDANGIRALSDFGFDKPDQENGNQFEQIIDSKTFEHLYLRMNLSTGIKLLQSPRITTLEGRQSSIVAQEERTVVISNKDGKIQTVKVKTGPSLSFATNILPNGELELMAIFELLEFLGYDDPRPMIMQVHKNNSNSQDQKTENQDDNVKTDREAPRITQPTLPRFKRLQLESTARLKSGQTLIMGGLKTSETIKYKDKIPMLGDIPLMGRLFRSEGTDTIENYIYVFITPRIVEDRGN